MDEKYQGYTNYATWNVNLWLNNDTALYQRMRGSLNRCEGNRLAGERIKEHCENAWRQSDGTSPQTPDKVGLKDVNWEEIAQVNRD
jgi:hypothetical protein